MVLRLILCCLLLASVRAAGAAPCGELQVSFYEHGALHYRDAQGHWTGIDKDVVEELARRTGCRFLPHTESRVRIWTAMLNGTLDMTVSGIATPEREQAATFISYLSERNFVILQPEAAQRVNSLDSFLATPDYKVAVIKSFKHGPTYDAWLDKLRAQGRVYETADYSSLLRLFKLRRVNAVLALGVSWAAVTRQGDMNDHYRLMDWAPRDRIIGGLVLSRQRVPEPVVAQFRRAIQAMREDGTLKAIFERHVGPELAAMMVNY
ncbi:MAG: substrate-binding periplasmic protein [Sphingomonadaceae bacterium]